MATGDVSPADRQAPGHPRGLRSPRGLLPPGALSRDAVSRSKFSCVVGFCWIIFFICYEAEERGEKTHKINPFRSKSH